MSWWTDNPRSFTPPTDFIYIKVTFLMSMISDPCASSNQNSLPGGSSNPILLSSVQSCSTSDKTYSGPSTTPKQEVEKQMK